MSRHRGEYHAVRWFGPTRGSAVRQDSEDIGAEQIAAADADWILYGVQAGADAATSNPLWPTLTAVQAGRVVDVDDDPWYLNARPIAASAVLTQLTETIEG